MSQNEQIYKHLKDYGHITSIESYEIYHCTRLAARIADLKKMGIEINTKMKKGKDANGRTVTYAEYSLANA